MKRRDAFKMIVGAVVAPKTDDWIPCQPEPVLIPSAYVDAEFESVFIAPSYMGDFMRRKFSTRPAGERFQFKDGSFQKISSTPSKPN